MKRLTFGLALDFGSRLRPLHEQLERQAALLEVAEEAGFEIVAAGESSVGGSFHLPNALLVLAAIAQRTRMRLCTGILLLPAWPLARPALDTAELDQLSDGRLILGIGIGSAALQARAGWPADAVGDAVDESLQALRTLWAGGSEYAGVHISVDAAVPILPAQGARLPIFVGGAIRRSARRAARLGDGWYGGVNYRLSAVPAQVQAYQDAGGEGAVVLNRLTHVSEVASEMEGYVHGALAGYARPGERLEEVIDEVALVGTPDHVAAVLERYAAAGVTHVFTRLSLDETPPEAARRTVALLGREVIPRFGG